ncbi:Flotillin domain-containing protein [Orpheovirus IHUMI-LCC2]|uniref:Flotillin domain-containing protein n=1 Tax=Orpheovirus IHUMI-LCC2 TaxID=2023057 RepID=A0A2I2L4B2_9VIRU|nr:Flotillin domain-containing protein [Orpheovirus IHUMI-LCC2]SNW62364.1 Flotillin domain-containing protein [Orpheovirus IHUMI-LCC2]
MLSTVTKSSGLLALKAIQRNTNVSTKSYQSKGVFAREQKRNYSESAIVIASSATIFLAGAGAYLATRYKISKPNEYLVRTGLGVRDVLLTKKGFQWPFQTFQFINMEPKSYTYSLQIMSSEKVDFILPVVFTVGPRDDKDSLILYSKKVSPDTDLYEFIRGIAEGQTRSVATALTIEEIFKGRDKFKEEILEMVQKELDKYGLYIYNANIKEMQDHGGSKYFENQRKKTISEVENKAKIDVSEATMRGAVGEKEREAETRKRLAEYEALTVLQENERQQSIEKSNAELEIVKADSYRRQQLAFIEAKKATEIRNAELQRQVEEKRILEETERLRAKEVSLAQVLAEAKIKEAEGEANAVKLRADAQLYFKQREADGIRATYTAQSEGLERLVDSLGGDRSSLFQYLMVEKDMYTKLAEKHADALQGLQPKITVWNTGGDNNTGAAKLIGDMMKGLAPVLSTVHDQTGLRPGEWFMKGLEEAKVEKRE